MCETTVLYGIIMVLVVKFWENLALNLGLKYWENHYFLN